MVELIQALICKRCWYKFVHQVHILSHIPPGNGDCWTIFSREFAKIINRFESTVAAQFYGHTHNDEYKIFYDLVELDRAVNVAFVAPSLTASSDNAGYRIYTIDGPRPGSTWVNVWIGALYRYDYLIHQFQWRVNIGCAGPQFMDHESDGCKCRSFHQSRLVWIVPSQTRLWSDWPESQIDGCLLPTTSDWRRPLSIVFCVSDLLKS